MPTAILHQRVPVSRLTASQRSIQETLRALPLTDTPLHERDAFAAMKERGMLHLSIRNAGANPSMRLVLRNLETAMTELRALGRFVSNMMEP